MSRRDDEAGYVTAETAVVLPVLVLVLLACVALIGAVTAQLRCLDAAREGARAAARGDADDQVRRAAREPAPRGAEVLLLPGADTVTVVVRVRAVPLPGPLARVLVPRVEGRATAAVEPGR